jgi:hypothetical protein
METTSSEAPRKRTRLLRWVPLSKGTLRGFADIELPSGLRIYGCPVHVAGNGRSWAGLPGKPQIDRDDRVIRIEGKVQYTRVNEWASPDLGYKFSVVLINLICANHPDALTDQGQGGETAK